MPESLGAAYRPMTSSTPQEDNPVRSTYNISGPPKTAQPGMDTQAAEQGAAPAAGAI